MTGPSPANTRGDLSVVPVMRFSDDGGESATQVMDIPPGLSQSDGASRGCVGGGPRWDGGLWSLPGAGLRS